jgi:hypothetical protein
MRRLSALVLLLALFVVGSSVGSARAASFQKAIWGPWELPVGNVNCSTSTKACSAFPLYREMGVDVFQFQIHWDEVAPTRPLHPRDPADPAYKWESIDKIVLEAWRSNIGLAALVQRAPAWANGGRRPIFAPDPKKFADFLTAASRRYPTIRRWMIWGEPARAENFQPMRRGNPKGPRRYAAILDRAYLALKKVSKANVVIGGMTLNGGTIAPHDFIRWLKLPNGKPPRMDLWGHNPFDSRFPKLSDDALGRFRGFNDIDTLHAEIKRAYRAGNRKAPRLWLSEWTIVSSYPLPLFSGFYVSRAEQATRLNAAYTIASHTKYVAGLGWFTLLDEPLEGEAIAGWGLMEANGSPKPSFYAYERLP